MLREFFTWRLEAFFLFFWVVNAFVLNQLFVFTRDQRKTIWRKIRIPLLAGILAFALTTALLIVCFLFN